MKKVLIVDDEPKELELLCDIMEKRFAHEVECKSVLNGRIAVTLSTIWNADVILMDIEMPELSGLEAAHQILQQRRSCKIIFVTAYSLFSYAHEAVKLGACDYILKPVETEDVVNAVRKAFSQLDAQRQMEALSLKREAPDDEGCDKNSLLIAKVKKYLQYNYMIFGLSLESVSDLLGMNASYLSVLFKKCTGTNFVDYLTDLKIAAAKELLEDPLRSASEIANLTGYESASYFTRAFKKNTGMTPTEYRSSLFSKQGRNL